MNTVEDYKIWLRHLILNFEPQDGTAVVELIKRQLDVLFYTLTQKEKDKIPKFVEKFEATKKRRRIAKMLASKKRVKDAKALHEAVSSSRPRRSTK